MQSRIIEKFAIESQSGEYKWKADITALYYESYTSYSVHSSSEAPNRFNAGYELYFTEEEAVASFNRQVEFFEELAGLLNR